MARTMHCTRMYIAKLTPRYLLAQRPSTPSRSPKRSATRAARAASAARTSPRRPPADLQLPQPFTRLNFLRMLRSILLELDSNVRFRDASLVQLKEAVESLIVDFVENNGREVVERGSQAGEEVRESGVGEGNSQS